MDARYHRQYEEDAKSQPTAELTASEGQKVLWLPTAQREQALSELREDVQLAAEMTNATGQIFKTRGHIFAAIFTELRRLR